MKILIICHEFPPIGGGAANAAFYIASHLKGKDHEVTVVTSRFKQANHTKYDFKMVYLTVLRKHIDRTSPMELISFAVSGIMYGLRAVRKNKYDACLAIHGIPSGWVALFLYKMFRIPYVVSLRGGDVPGFLPERYDRLHRKINFITRMYWSQAGALVANGSGLKKLADLVAKRINKEVAIIVNGVDCAFFKPDNSLRNSNSIRIMYCGRLTLQKGLMCFIKALNNAVKDIGNRFEVVLIGSGDLSGILEKESTQLIKEGRLKFKNRLNKESLTKEYQRSHIFILPSSYEGVSNSLLEAMACGCAIIASDISGNREFVKDDYNGFLFKPSDDERLGEILKYALSVNNLSAIEEMGRRSRKAAEPLGWSKVADSYLRELNASIARS